MPVNVVKTPRQERLWREAKKQAAEQGHAEDWDYVMGIYQKMAGLEKASMLGIARSGQDHEMTGWKSMSKALPPTMLASFPYTRIPGQVPTREQMELLRLAKERPKEMSVARLLAQNEPRLTVGGILGDLGMNAGQYQDWSRFLNRVTRSSINEVTLRQDIMSKCLNERLDGGLRRAILLRSLTYWRSLRKGMVQVVTADELQKAESPGGKYHRRVPRPGGGYRYFYDEDKYRNSKGAHTGGAENAERYIYGQIQKCIEKAGRGGCGADAFKGLVQKYGAKAVGAVLTKNHGKSFQFKKGRFTLVQKVNSGAAKDPNSRGGLFTIAEVKAAAKRRIAEKGGLYIIPEDWANEELRKGGPHKYVSRKRDAHGNWVYTYPEDLKKRVRNAIADFLENPKRTLTIGQAARSFRVDKGVALEALQKLEREGKVQKTGDVWKGREAKEVAPPARTPVVVSAKAPVETPAGFPLGMVTDPAQLDPNQRYMIWKRVPGGAWVVERSYPGQYLKTFTKEDIERANYGIFSMTVDPNKLPVSKKPEPQLVVPKEAEHVVGPETQAGISTEPTPVIPTPVKETQPEEALKTEETPLPVSTPEKGKAEKKPRKKVKKTGPAKLEQTGDHIWGSRKDLAQLGRITTSAQLEGMSYDDAAYIVRKSRLIPVHDLDTLKAMGMTPGTAHMTLALLAAIKAKPGDSAAERAAYVDSVRDVVGGIEKIKTVDDFKSLLNEFNQRRMSAKRWETVAGAATRDEAREKLLQLEKENPGTSYGLRYSYSDYNFEIARQVAQPYDSLGPRFTKFIKHSGKFYDGAIREALTADNLWTYNKREDVVDGWLYLQESDKAKKAEKKKKAEKRKSIHGETKRGWSGAKEVAGEVQRVGGTIEVTAADAERTKNTFGFREVDYGREGYMTQADREYHTKALEEAMYDFSEVLDMSPGKMSFNGRLGVALGARGRGKASAHYEPIKKVINITKFRGGGSLAHEWGHALDNIIATHYIKSSTGSSKGDAYLSSSADSASLPTEISAAVVDTMKAIETPPDPVKAKKDHEAFLKTLGDEVDKLVSQNNVLVSEHKELTRKPKTQETLERRVAAMKDRITEWESYIKTERPKIEERLKRGQHVSLNRSMEVSNREYWIKNYKKKIAELQKPDAVLSDANKARMEQIENEVEALRLPINRAREKYKLISKLDPTVSDYYKSAMILGRGYWGTPQELFARAFESYIEDTMRSKSRANTYLVAGTRHAYETDIPVSVTASVQPYPQGEERTHINAAMDRLMAVLRKTGALEKALQNLYILV